MCNAVVAELEVSMSYTYKAADFEKMYSSIFMF